MKRTLPLLREIQGYFVNARQQYHTSAAITGLSDVSLAENKKGILITHSKAMEKPAERKSKSIQCLSLQQVANGGLRGRRQTTLIDNCALHELCREAADEIESLQAQLNQKEAK